MINVNLLPPDIKEEISQARKNRQVQSNYWKSLGLLFLMIIILAGSAYLFTQKKKTLSDQLSTAQEAKRRGITEIGTSLRISPYQDQEKLLALAQQIATANNLNFYDFPLSDLYRESVQISKEMGMYRQKYCGCRYSKEYR